MQEARDGATKAIDTSTVDCRSSRARKRSLDVSRCAAKGAKFRVGGRTAAMFRSPALVKAPRHLGTSEALVPQGQLPSAKRGVAGLFQPPSPGLLDLIVGNRYLADMSRKIDRDPDLDYPSEDGHGIYRRS